MVHALEEAARVTKPDGMLIDLRPAPVHRRLSILHGGDLLPVGRLHEDLSDDHAADAAVRRFLRKGGLQRTLRTSFPCNRRVDTLADLRKFMNEFTSPGRGQASHERLIQRLERLWSETSGRKRVVISGPITMHVMRKKG
jgi:hypothetical protein